MIQISFRTQDPNIRKAQSGIRVKKLRLIHDPLGLQNPQIRSIYRTNPQSVLFLRPDPPIRKPIHPPLRGTSGCEQAYIGEDKVGKEKGN